MPERFEQYLLAVGEKIRWKRARPFALRELRTHLEEQKEDFLAAGLSEREAEEAALRDMGRAAEVGESLDAVHRPRQQWGFAMWAVLLSFGGCFLRVVLTAGVEYEEMDPIKAAAAVILGTALLLGMYHLDYTILARHGKAIYAAAIVAGILSLAVSPRVNGTSYYTRYVVLCYPVAYAAWLGILRGRGWKGFVLSVGGGVPLAMVVCMTPYTAGLVLLLVSGFAALLTCAGMDWFGVGRNQTMAAVFGSGAVLSLPMLWVLCTSSSIQRRMEIFLRPETDALGRGYWAMVIRDVLSGVKWLGQGQLDGRYDQAPLERVLPEWNHDCFLAALAFKLGWLPCLVLVGAVALLLVILLMRGMSVRNHFGRLLVLSAALPLAVQAAGATALNLGFILTSVPFPFLSGNLHTVMCMGMMGLLLSVFRQQALPEWQLEAEKQERSPEKTTYFS